MSTVSDHVREGFPRQRRNLIIMSLVVLSYQLLGVQFHTLNLLGNKIIIHNHHLVPFVLGALLIYYLWRYFTYFNDLGDKGIINSFYGWRNLYLNPFIIEVTTNSGKILSKLAENPNLELKEVSVNSNINGLKTLEGFVVCNFYESTPGTLQQQETVQFTVPGQKLIIPSFRSLTRLIFRSSLFNEYLWPFVVCTLPIFIAVYSIAP